MKMLFQVVAILSLGSLPLVSQTIPQTGMVAYGVTASNCTSPCVLSTYEAWFPAHFRLILQPNVDLSPYLTSGNIMSTYADTDIYAMQLYPYVWATYDAQGWSNPETALLHMTNADYYPTSGVFYSGINQFDAFEQTQLSGTSGNPLNAVHGVFTLVGATYTDVTVRSFCPDTSCATYTANPVTVSDRLLIGYQNPFDLVNVTLGTARVGGSATYQYWNGSSFSALTPVSDTTSGLTVTGRLTFAPPSDWAPVAINGSYSKYWIQVTISGTSTNPVISKIYGDNLLTSGCPYGTGTCARAWKPSACVSGHINVGTPLEYCAVPISTATARFLWQSRALGYGVVNDYYPLPTNQIDGKYTWAYVEQTKVAAALARMNYSGMNGVMFDNGGNTPNQSPSFNSANSDLGSTTYPNGLLAMYPALHTLLTETYGASPRWWDGLNALSSTPTLSMTMNWALTENAESVQASYLLSTAVPALAASPSTNPNSAQVMKQIEDFQQFNWLDGNGTALSNYHFVGNDQRSPMDALAMFWLVQNPNLLFAYMNGGFIYVSDDDYYYWKMSARTLAAPISASTCVSPVSIPLSGNLETSTCPGTSTNGCPLRIGGESGIVTVGTTYTGSTLNCTNSGKHGVILSPQPAGASVEYLVKSHQSQDNPLHTPIAMWGSHIPAADINLGTPDNTYGFGTQCTRDSGPGVNGGCIALTGGLATGNLNGAGGCNTGMQPAPNYNCAPLLRRDFTGGTYGKAIVLLRPVTYLNANRTASGEYDTPGQLYSLPGIYYQLNADGSVGTSQITSLRLKGGEAGIYVSGTTPPPPPANGKCRIMGNATISGNVVAQ